MNTYTAPQKASTRYKNDIDIISQGMQRIEDALRDVVECIEDGRLYHDTGELVNASSLKEALTICELMNPNNHTKGERDNG